MQEFEIAGRAVNDTFTFIFPFAVQNRKQRPTSRHPTLNCALTFVSDFSTDASARSWRRNHHGDGPCRQAIHYAWEAAA
ncbi:hypothetical protein KCP77_17535 [Salmonella enterica subsp. enterica]|nr:hypothetical protein KCP77_17535 [Salmonella enterica subsp. enterica]